MQETQQIGFSSVNAFMNQGTQAESIQGGQNYQYLWLDTELILIDGQIDRESVLERQMPYLQNRESILDDEQFARVIDKVFADNQPLLMEMSHAGAGDLVFLDKALESLIEKALVQEEHKLRVKLCRTRIQNTQRLNDGWMSFEDVNTMVNIWNKYVDASNPNPIKFLNRTRQ